MMNNLVLTDKLTGITFDFKLRRHITIIAGNSSTGKSLFYSTLEKTVADYNANNISNNQFDYSKVVLFNAKCNLSLVDILKPLKGYLIVLDNFDYLRGKYPDIMDFINRDIDNQFIIIGRRIAGLFTDIHAVSSLHQENNTFTLDYM